MTHKTTISTCCKADTLIHANNTVAAWHECTQCNKPCGIERVECTLNSDIAEVLNGKLADLEQISDTEDFENAIDRNTLIDFIANQLNIKL